MFKDLDSHNEEEADDPIKAKQMEYVFTTCQNAEAFVKQNYYNFIDTDRTNLMKLYKDNSLVAWNGTELRGMQMIESLYKEVPKTSHKVETYDAQYTLGGPSQSKQIVSVLIIVTGKVTFADTATHNFHQTLVLGKDPVSQNFYLVSDCMRLTS
ncbi:hypothetical protein SAMD00019534_034880 [Acytostelium subglobosum LB1]|uniref:hypothetical protein n=1 Tax=Acytostelium subglobosum LB1 TaxID=1410327 RepID=UPI000644914E|nr:hypothetical protein SAMD00019534_034880 [Acytostelium subglobosum LB1]GAM20313.1 hypothetical protein SAMD00019534_034880 [Acytostelium subglobosum LB1]|eukprot:XP_012759834.1 hypothetical protein SAMD00019534_034880 [Acytostelium subglobosum LB1]